MNLDQFKNWALSQGQVGNPNPGNTYLGQCVSLVQQYLSKVYGIGWTPRGDAKDWPSNANVLSYFDKVSSPQAGDIGVMGANFGQGYGHIFIYLSPSTIIEQNGRTPLRVTTGSAYANPIAILRRKGQGGSMATELEQKQATINSMQEIINQRDKVINQNTADLTAKQASIDSLQAIVNARDVTIKDLSSRVTALEKELAKQPTQDPNAVVITKDSLWEKFKAWFK